MFSKNFGTPTAAPSSAYTPSGPEPPEEGEITAEEFPYHKTYQQYYFYPHTPLFIGRNTIPRATDFTSDSATARFKRELRERYPAVIFSDKSKDFFNNHFTRISRLSFPDTASTAHTNNFTAIPGIRTNNLSEMTEPAEGFKLVAIETNYATIYGDVIPIRSEPLSYERFLQQVCFRQGNASAALIKAQEQASSRLIVLEDRMLEVLAAQTQAQAQNNIEEQKAPQKWIFMRVSSIEVNNSTVQRLILEDVFHRSLSFYEALEERGAEVVAMLGGGELRVFEKSGCVVVVHSGTTVRSCARLEDEAVNVGDPLHSQDVATSAELEGRLHRLYDGVDVERSAGVLLNQNGPCCIMLAGSGAMAHSNAVLEMLRQLRVTDGDYALAGGYLYRVDDTGEQFEWMDVDYNTFFNVCRG